MPEKSSLLSTDCLSYLRKIAGILLFCALVFTSFEQRVLASDDDLIRRRLVTVLKENSHDFEYSHLEGILLEILCKRLVASTQPQQSEGKLKELTKLCLETALKDLAHGAGEPKVPHEADAGTLHDLKQIEKQLERLEAEFLAYGDPLAIWSGRDMEGPRPYRRSSHDRLSVPEYPLWLSLLSEVRRYGIGFYGQTRVLRHQLKNAQISAESEFISRANKAGLDLRNSSKRDANSMVIYIYSFIFAVICFGGLGAVVGPHGFKVMGLMIGIILLLGVLPIVVKQRYLHFELETRWKPQHRERYVEEYLRKHSNDVRSLLEEVVDQAVGWSSKKSPLQVRVAPGQTGNSNDSDCDRELHDFEAQQTTSRKD